VAEVVGVVFRGGGKVYHFDPAGLELSRGDSVVVQTSSGPEIGQVVEPSHAVDDADIPAQLKKVARVATDKDLESVAANAALRKEAMVTCRELIATHGLDMKLVDAELGFGGEKITFSFTSEERVDFRNLVADLAKVLKVRIELRQVGAREEARMVGGLGPCGRGLCCSLFPGDDEPVSIRMAKEQNLPLNPVKISGLCGRLMCCLKYEQEQYVRFRKEAPPKGTSVHCPGGTGSVTGYSMTKDSLTVRMEDGSFGDVKLCTCERQEDGSLLVTPEEELPAAASWLESPAGMERLAAMERNIEASSAEDGEVGLGGSGEPADSADAERSPRGRGRRGRGRRRGPGRPPGQGGEGAGGPEQAGAGAAPGASGAPGPGGGGQGEGHGGGRNRGRRPDRPAGQRPDQRPGGGQGAPAGGAGGPGGGAGPGRSGEQGSGSEGSGGGSSRSRRRRRPRRPGGEGGGAAGGSSGGPGGPGGGSGGGGDSGS
jgi:cell fate regulator YaaT (PSP1 superfamily)